MATATPKKRLVIVESPTKARTMRKFLPSDCMIEASMGHVRDLPQSAADIPASLKEQEWTKIGVDVDNGFSPLYIVPKDKKKVISELSKKLKECSELYLATDEDREGESISWHLFEVLKPKVPVHRMVFHEITKPAIEAAFKKPRTIDTNLVSAQEARRILDRLYGYSLSPLIWKKIAYGLSAGRVQSVALRLIVDRERERLKFKKATYWDLMADLSKSGQGFQARILSAGGKRIAGSKDFDETTGQLFKDRDVKLLGQSEAEALTQKLKAADWMVESVEERELTSRPSPPFITSTLQQEANRKLGLSTRDTMRVAQRLYEEGLITYMRTDSPNLSQEAIQAARNLVKDLYGNDYLSPEPRNFSAKNKGAQEAHEAIRPAGAQFVHPKDTGLDGRELQVYELIWKRAVATQMADAKKMSVSVRLSAADAIFSASGTRILFPGFLRAYVEGRDDPEVALEDQETLLPAMKVGDRVDVKDLKALSHETKPAARFTEAALVQMMEKAGIGRPSTYASIIATLIDREYVKRAGNALVPTLTGFAVVQILEKHFERFVDTNFTSRMEEELDQIAAGQKQSVPYLKEFYLGKEGLQSQIEKQDKAIDANEARRIELPHLKDVDIRVGKYGAYIVQRVALSADAKAKIAAQKAAKEAALAKAAADGIEEKKSKKKKEASQKDSEELHASIPEDLAPSDLSPEKIQEILEIQSKGPQPIGKHPKTGENIYRLTGRFGPYVQQGEATDAKPKPRRASIPKGFDPKNLSLDQALQLLSLPKELGMHPKTGKPVVANAGRFGPYVVHDGDFRSLKKEDNVYTVTLDRALELLAQEKKGRQTATVLKELGPHPKDQKPVQVLDGKYGPYIKHASKNATLPKEAKPDAVTMEQALVWLEEAAARKKGGRGRARA
jgi:DNA topoisomerase-1